MTVTEAQVTEALRPVQDPELRRSIVDLGMVEKIAIDGGTVSVTVALTVPGCPLKAEIQRSVSEAVAPLDGVGSVIVEFTVMTDGQREAVRTMLHGNPAATAGTNPTHGHSEGREIPFGKAGSRTRVLRIASGKGGVGKSSITTNLAVALAQRGRDVAVVDADVWGFSIPRMLGVDQPPVVLSTQEIGLQMMIGLELDYPVRSSRVGRLIRKYLGKVGRRSGKQGGNRYTITRDQVDKLRRLYPPD